MAGKLKASIYGCAVFMIIIICFADNRTSAKTIRMNVFERFRIEMTISHDVAAAKFMSPKALAKWNAVIMPYFDKSDRQLSHFFAFSLLVPKMNNGDFYIIYFNPWVDGALLTHWKKVRETWKMEDFYFGSGERVRGQVAAQSVVSKLNIPPIWMLNKDTFLKNIFSYYRYMSKRLLKTDVREYISWFSLDDVERANDLLRVKLRMRGRIELALTYLLEDNRGSLLSGAFAKLKYDALTKNKKMLATYSRHADLLADLRPDITKSWRENWFFKKENNYRVVLSSPVEPRLFVFISVNTTGKLEGVLLGDLEAMAMMPQGSVASVKPAAPASSIRKVQRYKAPNGDQIEIITEKRGGKVFMTTRKNGQVTEVLTF